MTGTGRGFTRILVGTDGSQRAEEAARQGARLAAAFGADLDVVYVVDEHVAHDRDVETVADAALGRAVALAREAGVEADARIMAGDPADVLSSESSEPHRVDLVCIGPDAGLLSGAVRLGRVARHVLREARCSVMVARPSADFPSRITCGVDGSDASLQTAERAASIASATGAELHLVHVVPVFRGRDSEWTLEEDEESPSELARGVEVATALGVVPIRDMAMGRPEHALVAVARRDHSDLLVVGHRGLHGMTRVLLGSVSEYATEHAPCSVLVARP